MAKRHELTDAAWTVPEPLLPQTSNGHPWKDHRHVINGILLGAGDWLSLERCPGAIRLLENALRPLPAQELVTFADTFPRRGPEQSRTASPRASRKAPRCMTDGNLPPTAPQIVMPPEALRSLEAQIEGEIHRILRMVRQTTPEERERGADMLDVVASLLERETELAVRARCAEALGDWTRALRQLRESPGHFGRCERCQQSIPLERLEILPTARTCLTCC